MSETWFRRAAIVFDHRHRDQQIRELADIADRGIRTGGSSCAWTAVQGDFLQVAAGRTEERDGGSLSDRRLDGKSIHQDEGILTLFCCTADHAQGVEAHLR